MYVEYETHTVPAGDSAQGGELRGRLAFVQYKRPASGAYAAGAVVAVDIVREGFQDVSVLTGVTLAANNLWRPRADVHDSAGAAIADQVTYHVLANARVRITVTGGGAGNTGEFLVAIEK